MKKLIIGLSVAVLISFSPGISLSSTNGAVNQEMQHPKPPPKPKPPKKAPKPKPPKKAPKPKAPKPPKPPRSPF